MLNEQRITYRMKTLIESGFFGSKKLLSEAFADNDKVRLFQAAYNYTYNKNLVVDGIKGGQTDAAIADVKKQLGKDKLDNEGAKDFYQKFLVKLDENKANINVGQGGTNNNKNLNQAIQAVINLAGTPIAIDGVIGTKTIAAIKTVTDGDSEIINSETITRITGKAAKNILQLGVEGIATTQGGEKEGNAAEGEGVKSKFGMCLSGNCENGQGKLKNTENNIYIGTFIDFYHTGKNNEIQFANGDSFKGETLKGKPVNGTFKSKKGWTYTGGFNAQGKMEGTASIYTNAKGKQFRLNFLGGKPVGFTWEQIDSKEDDGFQTISKEAKDGAFKADMAKFKGIIDAKIKSGALTSKNNIFSGNYSKVGGGLQILDANNTLLFTTTVVPSELKEVQGRWSYYTGGGGSKLMNFATKNNMTKYVYTFPEKEKTAQTNQSKNSNNPPQKDDAAKKKGFNEDMKKLVEIIKDYRNQWGFYRVNANNIRFSDSFDKQIFQTQNVFTELSKIPSGRFWMYKPDTKTIFFYEADKNYYVHKIT